MAPIRGKILATPKGVVLPAIDTVATPKGVTGSTYLQ